MIQIREAVAQDLDQLAVLFDQYRVFYRKDSDREGAKKFLLDRMTNNESVIFVAEADKILTGFVQLFPQFSSTRMRQFWILNDLFILQEYRRTGISLKLIGAAKALAEARKSAGLLLETEKTNHAGNRLYPAAGFTRYDQTNFYWWENSSQ